MLRTLVVIMAFTILALSTSCTSTHSVDPSPEKVFKKN